VRLPLPRRLRPQPQPGWLSPSPSWRAAPAVAVRPPPA